MKALLDTHAFLWAITGDERLSKEAQRLFVGPSDLWLSLASLWEIVIKVQVGRLHLSARAGPYVVKKMAENRIGLLSVELDHVLRIEELPMHHRDPFDRMLIAQSLQEKLPLVSADPVFARYPIEVIW